MWPHRACSVAGIGAFLVLAGLLRPSSAVHFDCSGYEDVKGEVQDASGYVCASKCAADTFNCPTDVPAGTTAQPQCMLQDVDKGAFCGLLCQVDSQCPNGSRCRQMKQVEVGLCLYPVSFSDWARQTTNRKFNVAFPTRAGGASAGSGTSSSFQIAKTYAALQSLKSKYSIDDGDADMLVLKELLSSMTAATAVGGTPVAGPAGLVQGPQPASVPAAVSAVIGQPKARDDFGINAWGHDIRQFEGYVGDGLPGIEREIHDTVWNIENFGHRDAALHLFRGVILVGVAYVSIGSFFKYQSGATGMDMIPHISFWMEYPNLVADGVTYSKILLGLQSPGGEKLSGGIRSGGAGAFETL